MDIPVHIPLTQPNPEGHSFSEAQKCKSVHPISGFPVNPGRQEHRATCLNGVHNVWMPQTVGMEQGFKHLLLIQISESTQSVLYTHSKGTHSILGSPKVWKGQEHCTLKEKISTLPSSCGMKLFRSLYCLS